MKTTCINKLFFLFSVMIVLLGCSKKNADSTCLSFKQAPVTIIEGANTALVNQEIILTVSFTCFNGCGQFGNYDELVSGNTTTLSVQAKYAGCICTQDVPTRQTTYRFKKSLSGTYYLKFLQTDNTYLTHTIVVQ